MYVYRIGEPDDFLYWDKGRGLWGIIYDGMYSKDKSELVKIWHDSLDAARDEWEAKKGVKMRGG